MDRSAALVNRHTWLGSYEEAFGQIDPSLKNINQIDMDHLLRYADIEPDPTVNNNPYQAPTGRLARWKWLTGLSNDLDWKVQCDYNKAVRLLEKSQATSIFQLKNQLQTFWHLDREIHDYQQLRFSLRNQIIDSGIGLIFFRCIRFFLSLFYDSVHGIRGNKNLRDRSLNTFAQIGSFKLKEEEYDVVAFHPLGDETTYSSFRTDRSYAAFHSVSYGRTRIGIFKKQTAYNYDLIGSSGPNHNFSVLIGRELDDSSRTEIVSEDQGPERAVREKRRHLVVSNYLGYRDTTEKVKGSDRELDQKLTQIMIEVAMQQNRDMLFLRVDACRDDLPVLIASGFKGLYSTQNSDTMEGKLNEFRKDPENGLFPPYSDYGGIRTKFKMADVTKKNVSYTRGPKEAWDDIIARGPILRPGAAVLPEYWVVKPTIAADGG